MPQGIFQANDSTEFFTVPHDANNAHVALTGTFGGGTVALNQRIAVNNTTVPLRDLGTAIIVSAPDDLLIALKSGDTIGLTLSGSTTPQLAWSITF